MPAPPYRIAVMMEWRHTYGRRITAAAIQTLEGYPQCQLILRGMRPIGLIEAMTNEIRAARLDGIIVDADTKEFADFLASLQIPVIDVAGSVTHPDFLPVLTDNHTIGQLAARYLSELNYPHFSYLGYHNQHYALDRFAGFRAELQSRGARCVHDHHLPIHDFLLTDLHTQSLKDWLGQLPKPCAIFAAHDLLISRLWDLCRDMGLAVPQQIALLGVDNEAAAQEIFQDGLSTIEQDLDRIGQEAVRRLVQRLEHPDEPLPPPLLLPPLRLLRRASTENTQRDALIEQARKIIHSQATQGLSVPSLVKQLHVSRRTLERRFQYQTGQTLHEAIGQRRLDEACRLLRQTQWPINQIAHAVGFAEQRDLTRLLQRYRQQSPSQYRRAHASGDT